MKLNLAIVLFAITALFISLTDAQDCKKTVRRPKKVIKNGLKVTEYVEVKVCCENHTRYRGRCAPVCDNLCENAECTAPNVCSCSLGYTKLTTFRCVPQCDYCKFGFCSAPGICDCYRGYEKNSMNGTCTPVCNNRCVNGFCSDPDFCSCYDGYKISNENPYTCILNKAAPPIALAIAISPDEEDLAQKIKFEVAFESILSSTTVSTTELVGATSDVLESTESSTILIAATRQELTDFGPTNRTESLSQSEYCDSGCQPGKCIQDVCHCAVGYTYRNDIQKCISECEVTCSPGSCTEDNSCKCSVGYELKNQIYCTPICSFGCGDGICVEPGRCKCFTGLMVFSENSADCNPKCGSEGCVNGTCVAPDICQCNRGYIKSSANRFICNRSTTKNAEYILIVRKDAESAAKAGLISLYVLLAIIGFAAFILIKCYLLRKYSGSAYNIDILEKKKGTVKYFSDMDNVITA